MGLVDNHDVKTCPRDTVKTKWFFGDGCSFSCLLEFTLYLELRSYYGVFLFGFFGGCFLKLFQWNGY